MSEIDLAALGMKYTLITIGSTAASATLPKNVAAAIAAPKAFILSIYQTL